MAGYNQPQHPKDEYAKKLYKENRLDEAPTMEAIEPIATRLLSSVSTAFTGAEMILGRRVGSGEVDIVQICLPITLSPETKFGLLLLQRASEENL